MQLGTLLQTVQQQASADHKIVPDLTWILDLAGPWMLSLRWRRNTNRKDC